MKRMKMKRNVHLKMWSICCCLLLFLHVCNGSGTYTLSSQVIPHDARRQGLQQDNPCPGDIVEFTCIRSESSSATVTWFSDGMVISRFAIPSDIDTTLANQTSHPGVTGILVNETTLTLRVDLNTASIITNGSQVSCEGTGGSTSPSVLNTIIGVASSPQDVTIQPIGLSGLMVNMSIPLYGNECVDMYSAHIEGNQTSLRHNESVTDPSRSGYSFYVEFDICQEQGNLNVTAVSHTDGVDVASYSVQHSLSRTIIKNISETQFFTSFGLEITFTWKVIDFNTTRLSDFLCNSLVNTEVINCTNITVSEEGVYHLMYHHLYDILQTNLTFVLNYSNNFCQDSVIKEIKVKSVNSSTPSFNRNSRLLTVAFLESLFDNSSVAVNFSSQCTESMTLNYSNPLTIMVPNRVLSENSCMYTIQLVDRYMLMLQIGYPVYGQFESPTDAKLAIILGTCIPGITIVVIVLALIATVAYFYKRKKNRIHSQKETVKTQEGTVITQEETVITQEETVKTQEETVKTREETVKAQGVNDVNMNE